MHQLICCIDNLIVFFFFYPINNSRLSFNHFLCRIYFIILISLTSSVSINDCYLFSSYLNLLNQRRSHQSMIDDYYYLPPFIEVQITDLLVLTKHKSEDHEAFLHAMKRRTGEPQHISCGFHVSGYIRIARGAIYEKSRAIYTAWNFKQQVEVTPYVVAIARTEGIGYTRHPFVIDATCIYFCRYRIIFPRQGARISKPLRWFQLFLDHH